MRNSLDLIVFWLITLLVRKTVEETSSSYEHIYAPQHEYKPIGYSFSYGVKDLHTGDVKDQWEKKEGGVIKGHYSLLEADGSVRIVDYTADDKNGFNAIVKHEGISHHPSGKDYHHEKEEEKHEVHANYKQVASSSSLSSAVADSYEKYKNHAENSYDQYKSHVENSHDQYKSQPDNLYEKYKNHVETSKYVYPTSLTDNKVKYLPSRVETMKEFKFHAINHGSYAPNYLTTSPKTQTRYQYPYNAVKYTTAYKAPDNVQKETYAFVPKEEASYYETITDAKSTDGFVPIAVPYGKSKETSQHVQLAINSVSPVEVDLTKHTQFSEPSNTDYGKGTLTQYPVLTKDDLTKFADYGKGNDLTKYTTITKPIDYTKGVDLTKGSINTDVTQEVELTKGIDVTKGVDFSQFANLNTKDEAKPTQELTDEELAKYLAEYYKNEDGVSSTTVPGFIPNTYKTGKKPITTPGLRNYASNNNKGPEPYGYEVPKNKLEYPAQHKQHPQNFNRNRPNQRHPHHHHPHKSSGPILFPNINDNKLRLYRNAPARGGAPIRIVKPRVYHH